MSAHAPTEQSDRIAHFFEHFLPERIATLGLEEMDSFSVNFGFVIDDLPDGHWVFCFQHGVLVETQRAISTPGQHESFSYHMDTDAFWQVVGGDDDPRSVFLSGHAEIIGDVEQALKVGMILAQFSRVHPYPHDSSTEGTVDA